MHEHNEYVNSGVCKDLTPISVVEGEGFCVLMAEVCPEYEVSLQKLVTNK